MSQSAEVTAEEQIAKSIIPYNMDDSRARYLGLRASGFSIREALKLIGNAKSTLSFWRTDPEFVELETRLPEFRRTLASDYAVLEFLRNFRLILEKDYRVLRKSLDTTQDDKGKPIPVRLSDQEHQYLLKLRAFYTPQQLQVIEALSGAYSDDGSKNFDFTEFAISVARSKESVVISARKKSVEVGTVVEGQAKTEIQTSNDSQG